RPRSVEGIYAAALLTRLRFRYHAPGRLSWSQERGSVDSFDGSWTLESLGDGRTRATYTLDCDPGPELGRLITGPIVTTTYYRLVGNSAYQLRNRAEHL